MKLRMWGTRGSLPRAMSHDSFLQLVDFYAQKAEQAGYKSIGEFRQALSKGELAHPLVFGGNTTCNEVIYRDHRFFVDMGTGFAEASQDVLGRSKKEVIVFVTHLHWDHIMGLPFFVPVYVPGTKLIIYHVHPHAPEYIRIQFNGINFPVKWEELSADVEFRRIKLYDQLQFGDLTVSPFALDHPGGSFGYRFEADGYSMAIGVDGEYKRITREALGRDLPYYQNLDLLVFDGQYEMDELASRYDWGHCSPPIGVDFALREGIRTIIMTHHDPRSNEQKELRMLQQAQEHCKKQLIYHQDVWLALKQAEGPRILLAYDGMEFDMQQIVARKRLPSTHPAAG